MVRTGAYHGWGSAGNGGVAVGEEYEYLRALLADRPIAYHPVMARLLGGVYEALLFQQLAFWSGKGHDPEWIYKTQAELLEELALNRYQQEQARANLRRLGVIEERRRGVPSRLYFRVVWPKVFALCTQIRPECASSASLTAEGQQPTVATVGSQGRLRPADKDADPQQ